MNFFYIITSNLSTLTNQLLLSKDTVISNPWKIGKELIFILQINTVTENILNSSHIDRTTLAFTNCCHSSAILDKHQGITLFQLPVNSFKRNTCSTFN